MQYEDINDPIEVIALFSAGKLQPIKFRWRGRVYKIQRVNGRWESDEGRIRLHHYSVMADSPDVYEITYNPDRFIWKLDRVCMEG
ncbi:hypothetical protein ISS30_04185 [bacterium]|nr:hypothetical protein [FCB group bacterium]MBL7190872.1 hypothetical protein [bacterium]